MAGFYTQLVFVTAEKIGGTATKTLAAFLAGNQRFLKFFNNNRNFFGRFSQRIWGFTATVDPAVALEGELLTAEILRRNGGVIGFKIDDLAGSEGGGGVILVT